MAYATCVDSDQTAHPRSLIRVYAGRLHIARTLKILFENKVDHVQTKAQDDLSVRWSHTV